MCKCFFDSGPHVCAFLSILFICWLNKIDSLYRCIKGEPAIEEYFEMYSEAEIYRSQIVEAVMQSPGSQQYLNPGRVVVVKSESVSSLRHLVPSILVEFAT